MNTRYRSNPNLWGFGLVDHSLKQFLLNIYAFLDFQGFPKIKASMVSSFSLYPRPSRPQGFSCPQCLPGFHIPKDLTGLKSPTAHNAFKTWRLDDLVSQKKINYDLLRGGFQKKWKFGPLAETSGGVRAGSEGPIELFGDQKCRNNESFS